MSVKDMVMEGLERCRLHDGSVCKNCNYSHTECVEGLCADAIKLIEQQQAEIERLKAEKTKAIENIDLYIADAESDAKIQSRTGKGYSVGLGYGLLIAKEILQGIRNHG